MATTTKAFLIVFLCSLILLLLQGVNGMTFSITNNCDFAIWPGILSIDDHPQLDDTGFLLDPDFTVYLPAPDTWAGRIWGRTHCDIDSNGKFYCLSGDCATGSVSCSGNGGNPPTTLAEFILDPANGNAFYDISLVGGFNLPLSIVPDVDGCSATSCTCDNQLCPAVLKQTTDVGEVFGCKSPCFAYQTDQCCCTGEYSDPNACTPTEFSKVLKDACPSAHIYPYDIAATTFTCAGATNYIITFCP